MAIVTLILGVCLGAVIGWWVARARALAAASRAHEAMAREVRRWQESAERARAETAQIAKREESWEAGCRQGRDDVISIVPLLMAAREQAADTGHSAVGGSAPG